MYQSAKLYSIFCFTMIYEQLINFYNFRFEMHPLLQTEGWIDKHTSIESEGFKELIKRL